MKPSRCFAAGKWGGMHLSSFGAIGTRWNSLSMITGKAFQGQMCSRGLAYTYGETLPNHVKAVQERAGGYERGKQ